MPGILVSCVLTPVHIENRMSPGALHHLLNLRHSADITLWHLPFFSHPFTNG